MSHTSLRNVEARWIPEIRHYCPNTPIVLAGTKLDIRETPKVQREKMGYKEEPICKEEGHAVSQRLKVAAYVECSALSQRGMKEVFDQAITLVVCPKVDTKKAKKKHNKCCVM